MNNLKLQSVTFAVLEVNKQNYMRKEKNIVAYVYDEVEPV